MFRAVVIGAFAATAYAAPEISTSRGNIVIGTGADVYITPSEAEAGVGVVAKLKELETVVTSAQASVAGAPAQVRQQGNALRQQTLATMSSTLGDKVNEINSGIARAVADYNTAASAIRSEVTKALQKQRATFRENAGDAHSSARTDADDLGSAATAARSAAAGRINAKVSTYRGTASARLDVVEREVNTRLKKIADDARDIVLDNDYSKKANDKLAELIDEADEKLDEAKTLALETFSDAKLLPKHRRIWSGGCSYTMHSWGWQRYCYDRTDFDTAGADYYSILSNTYFRSNVDGFWRINAHWWTHTYWADMRLFINGAQRHYGKNRGDQSRHWRTYWGDAFIDSVWPVSKGWRIHMDVHRTSGSHQWHGFCNSGCSRVQFEYMGLKD